MADRSIQITRRRLLGSVVTIGGAGAASGAGTMAFFSDTETSADNTIQAGTLDLTLDGGASTVEFLNRTGIKPTGNTEGPASVKLQNTGSIPGYITVTVPSVTNYENGQSGDESGVDDTGGNPGVGNGELQNYLLVKAEFENRGPLWTDFQPAAEVLSETESYEFSSALAPGQSDTMNFSWRLPSNTPEIAQSDGLEFAFTFHLNQRMGSNG